MDSETDIIVYMCIHLVMPGAVAIGIIGNLLSILVFARREMIKFCVSIFTIVLALSDILLLITSLFNIILPDFPGGTTLSDKWAFWWYVIEHVSFDKYFLIDRIRIAVDVNETFVFLLVYSRLSIDVVRLTITRTCSENKHLVGYPSNM
jgi:hypothetical protein